MKFHKSPFTLSLLVALTSASKITFKQVKHLQTLEKGVGENSFSHLQRSVAVATNDTGLNLNTVDDLIYIVDIKVGGIDFSVQLDTGSSDLWIKGATSPLPGSHRTATTCNLTYAIGWAYGNIAYAPVEFANLSIPSQALLDVTAAQNPVLGYGGSGIVGLGFTSLSTIDRLVNVSGASTGRSLLYNMFRENPKEPNFLAFVLQRSTTKDEEVAGSFSIGEYDPDYIAVANSTAIPTWPVRSPTRWNVLLDAVVVHDTILIPKTSVVGAPNNKAVVLMDSGSSYTYAPSEICNAIYSNITGAYYNPHLGQWIVPCNYEVDMALQIGGEVFPLHPLDVTPNDLINNMTCVGSFVPQVTSVGRGDFDWIIGVNFLRSVYSIYDFGDFNGSDQTNNPYMKFLSIINPDEASVDFHKIRGGVPKTNITYRGVQGAELPSSNVSRDVSSSLEKIGRYLPAFLAIVAFNALTLIVLVIIGSVVYCRRRGSDTTARNPRGRMSPMPMNFRNTYIAGGFNPVQPHTYEPVSMALTEDTFVPPSPAFHNSDGSRDRPKSMA